MVSQVTYILELARTLGSMPRVHQGVKTPEDKASNIYKPKQTENRAITQSNKIQKKTTPIGGNIVFTLCNTEKVRNPRTADPDKDSKIIDPPDKDPDPDTLKFPGYPIRSRPIKSSVIMKSDYNQGT
ncbi:hypothetical protein YC2023_018909 [Brassica napus]